MMFSLVDLIEERRWKKKNDLKEERRRRSLTVDSEHGFLFLFVLCSLAVCFEASTDLSLSLKSLFPSSDLCIIGNSRICFSPLPQLCKFVMNLCHKVCS
jgi:hypothetical protein